MDPHQVKWYVERAGADSTGAVLGLRPPEDVSLQQTPGGKSLVSMLLAHELDAALVGRIPPALFKELSELVDECRDIKNHEQ
jgi:hypothetical protein